MEEILAAGQADVIQMGRGLLSDPDFPMKARMGMEDDIDTCMRCYACLSNSTLTRRRACAINPEIGHELESRYDRQPDKKKRILVAGGGVAGMAAAMTAAKQGHEVILCEKSVQLGGVLNCEKNIPFKARLRKYLERQARRLSASGVDIRLNTEADARLAEALGPDVIIAALGARPIKPNISGIDGGNVFGAEEIYLNPTLAGNNVVILGGGLVGTELGIYLAGLGRRITIVEKLPSLNHGGNMVHFNALTTQIERLRLRLELGTSVSEINNSGVMLVPENAEHHMPRLLEADTVIYAIGQKPLWDEADALRFCAPEFHQIGDCLSPKNIMAATTAAYTVARDIGRL
jgi:pyruvate/2-oxoglutarate dehydrogenase complex dihydrolipoamide dehydrogenase (E3) component